MPSYSLNFDDDVTNEEKVNEIEPPHPIGFGQSWTSTWISLEPLSTISPGRSTYALDFSDDEDDFLDKREQSYPPLSSYINANTAPTSTLLRYRDPPQHYDDEDSSGDEEDDILLLCQKVARRQQTILLPQITSPSKPLPSWSQTNRMIEQKIQQERQRMEQEHRQANKEVQSLVEELELQAAKIRKDRQDEENALRKEAERKAEEERRQKEIERQAVERKQQERLKEIEKEKERKAAYEKKKMEQAAAVSKKTEFVAKAEKLVAQLVQVRKSIEPFEKNKAVSKRRLGMKKVVRGKVNTLSENAAKVQEVAAEVSQAINVARQEDEQIKQGLERKDPALTDDMRRGKRYLVDLLASNTIQRVQADGFNGPRGDGFPLAAMLAMVSLENKELVPILAAHIYTVCPTAIPTLPTPAPNASEDELMSSLGMQKDKKGEYESFDKFISRTENIISLVANIMSSSPSTHALLGGHKGAVDWLRRFLDLLPPSPTSPLPLLTAPVLHGFLTGAGHMLANKHPESFKDQLHVITSDIMKRLDDGPIGKPSSIRLAKLLEDGFGALQTTLPPKALPELYYGTNVTHGHGSAPKSISSGNTANASPFGQQLAGAATSSPFGKPATGVQKNNPFGGGTGQSMQSKSNTNPFGGPSKGVSNPFGVTSTATTNAPNQKSMSDSAPSNINSNFGTPSSAPFGSPPAAGPISFGGNAPAPSPFGGGSTATTFGVGNASTSHPFGGGSAAPSPFGGGSSGVGGFGSSNTSNSGFGTSMNGGFGAPAPAPSPFGGPIGGGGPKPSPFGGAPAATASPFGAPSGSFSSSANSNPSPFGGGNSNPPFGSSSSTFGKPAPSPSPFGNVGGSSFGGGLGSNQQSNKSNTFGGGGEGKGQQPPCKFFAQGRCKFGKNCKFSHETGGGSGFGFASSNSAPSPFGRPRR